MTHPTVVLAYDIPADSRRARLFKRLHAHLRPVQKSVFEAPVPTRRLPALHRLLNRLIDPAADSVRVYLLCPACAASTTLLGRSPVIESPDAPLIL